MYEEPIPPRVRVPHVSAELETLIMRCLEKQPERRYQTMQELLSDLELVKAGLQPVGPDTWTLPPTRPPRPWRRGASSIYVGGLALALLVLVGTIAVGAFRKPEREAAENGTLQAAPEPDTSALIASRPAPLLPPPMLAPLIGEDASPEPREADAIASASDAGAAQAPEASNKQVRRKPRRRPKPAPARDRSILDPWN
jgi:hypothetical protein